MCINEMFKLLSTSFQKFNLNSFILKKWMDWWSSIRCVQNGTFATGKSFMDPP